jgi:uncharacterized protein (DUF2267 family)
VRYGDIVTEVKRRAKLPTVIEADKATRATLSVLGQRLDACPGRHLAFKLPAGLAAELPDGDEPVEFGVTEFYDRVARREGASPEVARQHARVVAGALRDLDSVPGMAEIYAQLPDEYAELWQPADQPAGSV